MTKKFRLKTVVNNLLTFLYSDKPDALPNTVDPYNNIEAYCIVVRSRLKNHSIGRHSPCTFTCITFAGKQGETDFISWLASLEF